MASTEATLPVDSIEDTIKAFGVGQFVIVLDSPHRENEGDLIIAADALTPAKMSFLIRHSTGIICAPIAGPLCDALNLPQMLPPSANADPNGTAYTISIDAEHADTSTGVSAADRTLTCRLLAEAALTAAAAKQSQTKPGVTITTTTTTLADDPAVVAHAASFRRPGHVFPLRARPGGVLERQGHTEAALDLCRLSGRAEAGVISEMVVDGVPAPGGAAELVGGGMMRGPECVEFAKRWGLKVCTIEDLVAYRTRVEGVVNGVGK